MYITYFWVDSWLKLMNACAEQMQPFAADGDTRMALANELEQLRAAHADSEAALAKTSRQRDELRGELERRQREAEAERADLARQLEVSAADAEKRLRGESAARAAAQAESEALRQKLSAAEAAAAKARAAAQAETEALRQQLSAAEAAAARAVAEGERRHDESTALRDKSEAAVKDAKALAAKWGREAEAERKKVQALAAEADTVRNENRRLATEAAALEQKIGQLSAELDATRAQLNSAQAAASAAPPPAATSAETKLAKRPRKTAAPVATQPAPATVHLALRFRKPDSWAEPVYVHYWDTDPAATEPAWPGTAMANVGDGWWTHRVEGVRSASLVFNDAAGNQTGNMHRERSGRLDIDGGWADE